MDKDKFEKLKLKRIEKLKEYQKKRIEKLNSLSIEEKKDKSLKKFSKSKEDIHIKDENFYKDIWYSRPHYCENCGKFLGLKFKNEDKVINLYRYAHILPKSTYPYLRHYNKNIMLLCLDCHTKFDNSLKSIVENMKCFDKHKIECLERFHSYLKNKNIDKYK